MIIVDDERPAAKLLEVYINTYAADFEIAGLFEDGIEAVKYLSEHPDIDVVMTDIKMKKMSGTQLAKYVYDMRLDTKVIFVSNYDDFKHAQDAIKYGVFGYLLKAVDVDELSELMDNLRSELNRKNELDEVDIDLQRECFFENLLLEGFGTGLNVYSELERCKFGIKPESFICTVLKISIEGEEKEKYTVTEKMEQVLTGIIKCALNVKFSCCVMQRDNCYYMVIADEKGMSSTEELTGIMNDILSADIRIELFYSRAVEELLDNPDEIPAIGKGKAVHRPVSYSERERMIKTACEYVNGNLKNDISRDTVAGIVGLSPAYFGRMFKTETGISFTDYVYQQRMKYAEELLSAGAVTSEICDNIGLRDERNFRRVFKEYSGMTPAEYRKNALKKSGR